MSSFTFPKCLLQVPCANPGHVWGRARGIRGLGHTSSSPGTSKQIIIARPRSLTQPTWITREVQRSSGLPLLFSLPSFHPGVNLQRARIDTHLGRTPHLSALLPAPAKPLLEPVPPRATCAPPARALCLSLPSLAPGQEVFPAPLCPAGTACLGS